MKRAHALFPLHSKIIECPIMGLSLLLIFPLPTLTSGSPEPTYPVRQTWRDGFLSNQMAAPFFSLPTVLPPMTFRPSSIQHGPPPRLKTRLPPLPPSSIWSTLSEYVIDPSLDFSDPFLYAELSAYPFSCVKDHMTRRKEVLFFIASIQDSLQPPLVFFVQERPTYTL